ncbi:ABC transporter ATP-binding protein/permease [Staphylococcus agnetis]|uniref:ABC transporter ATP-binding protein n=1 Tax=Staphylococcus agnetis TaxID=985762 RepID=UPI00208E84E3|nr:ABC transporter ATP-binding protein [Staphylococcus agnetis]MCO4327805.1 ABC transporter ATP-binding protein/permease [Staphylococcus agnetis]MCO4353490.1 ABC transporter ATP-binding protein/permease [Staphylococcus agnetis]MCO4370190.1 ABC transporter ATP-binding protein/permease [Staphylococcus agnetis]
MGKKQYLKLLLNNIEIPKRPLLIAILISSLGSLSGLLIPYFAGNFVDDFVASELDFNLILYLAGIFFVSTLLSGFGLFLLNKIGEDITYSLRNVLSSHIIRLQVSFFDSNETGNLVSRLLDDASVVSQFLTQKLPSLFPSILVLLGSFFMLFIIDWKTTILTFLLIPTLLLIMTPLSKKIQKISIFTQARLADFSSNLSRVFSEIRLLKTSCTEIDELDKIKKNLDDIYAQGIKKAKISSIIQPISAFLILITVGTILVYGGIRVSNGDITTGNLISMIFYVVQLSGPLAVLASVMTDYQLANGASIRLVEILNETPEYLTSTDHNIMIKEENIHFKNVCLKYDNELVLKNISFTIPSKKTTAIVGPSGSGKSTILNALARLYPIESGSILIGEHSIYDIALENWRSEVGYIMQKYNLMNGTVRDNILYGIKRAVTEKEITLITKIANCYDFIKELEFGFDTYVGEKGVKLSGGEAQRINIARTFLKNPSLIFLDEATANLDSENEQFIYQCLNNLSQSCTTVIVAHRLSTIQSADNIIFLDNGCITGQGSHLELMENHLKYRHFVELQNANL